MILQVYIRRNASLYYKMGDLWYNVRAGAWVTGHLLLARLNQIEEQGGARLLCIPIDDTLIPSA